MDDRRFDDITKAAAGGTSRRRALKLLGGGAASGLLGLFGARAGAAQEGGPDCCPPEKPRLCDDRCVNLSTDPDNCGSCGTICRGNETCQEGVCVRSGGGRCPSGTTTCRGTCVDLTTDERNCGACGTVCASGETCQDGVCVGNTTECPPGFTDCNGVCVDLNTDVNNCGACGSPCEIANGTASCANGTCMIASCNPGYADCDSNSGNGCETDLSQDVANCGACGTVCADGETCQGGVCSSESSVCGDGICDPGECTGCPGDCGCEDGNECTVDSCDDVVGCMHTPVTDGTSCGAGGTCQAGVCVGGVQCTADTDCGACGICVDGACEPATTGTVCRAAASPCDVAETCDGSSFDCPDDAVAPNGTACDGGTCQDGVCVASSECEPGQTAACGSDVGACQAGTMTCQADGTWGPCEGAIGPQPEICDGLDNDCDGLVDEDFDLQTDPLNCGQCGTVCASGETCQDGLCVGGTTECPSGFTDCGGMCVDLNTDVSNCGACGAACTSGRCVQGVCEPVCGDGICDPLLGEDCTLCPQDCGPCQEGFCQTTDDCDDGNPCTIDSCDEAHDTCVHTAVLDGTVCGDGLTCQNGVCQ